MVAPLKADAFKKVTVTLGDIRAELKLTPAGSAMLTPEATIAGLLAGFVEQGFHSDALRLLARALPKREAVWWACLCARDTLPADAPSAVVEALAAAEAWVYNPVEDNRRAAMARAEAAGFETPSSWAAVAAFWSGGSLSPPSNPVVPPGEGLTAAAVSGALLLAAVQPGPQHADTNYRRFIEYGVDIAKGGNGRDKHRA